MVNELLDQPGILFIEFQVVKVTEVGAAVVLPPRIRLAGREYNSRPNVSLAT